MSNNLEERFEYLLELIKKYDKNVNFSRIKQAFEFAKAAHLGEKRLSGIDAIWHPLETSVILASWKMDEDTIVAGLIHDTVEHGAATKDDILNSFGSEILSLVEGITDLSSLKIRGSVEETFVENLRKMFLSMIKDFRVVFLRLAERLDNSRSLEYLPEDRRRRYAIDSLEIYAPLAERIGRSDVRADIENLSFKHAYPEIYKDLVAKSAPYYKGAEDIANGMKERMMEIFAREELDAEIKYRIKGLYSLWKKLQRPEIAGDLNKVHDYVALRVLTKNESDCYKALGLIHKIFRKVDDIPVSDYIANPKPNGYRSIHLKVWGPKDRIVEIQIRTYEMHEEAEYGASAHWYMSQLKNKGGLTSDDIEMGSFRVSEEKIKLVRQLVEWHKDIGKSKDRLKLKEFSVFQDRVFVFSPNGDVYDLPRGSTVLDFAFAVHSELGFLIKVAKIGGKIVPLNYQLKGGEVVEIVKSKSPRHPTHEWLDMAMTKTAKREIKRALRSKALLEDVDL
jgi:GTP pyrophosphokinase